MVKHVLLLLVLFGLCSKQVLSAQTQDTLKIGYYHSPPFVIDSGTGELSGISIWMWDEIQRNVDTPHKWIKYDSVDPLNQLLLDLEAGEIDLSVNPLTITHDRAEKMDFSYPFYIGNLTLAQKTDGQSQSILSVLKDFFNKKVLILILVLAGMVLLFGLIIWIVEKKNQHFERGFRGLLSSFWWSAVTMTTVGYGDKVPISNLGRFIAFIWMLCSIIIIAIFTASITSTWTVKKIVDSNLSLETYKQARVGTVESSATEEYLNRNFFRNVILHPALDEGLHALANDELDYFIYDEPWLITHIQNNPEFASLEILPVRFNVQLYALPMRKGSENSFEDAISESILHIIESKDWEMILAEYQLSRF